MAQSQSESQSESNASFEQQLAELEQIVEQLESGDLELAESMQKFKRGVELSQACRSMLDEAQQTVEEITADSGSDSEDLTPPDETSD